MRIKHENTADPICPWCGHQADDDFEAGEYQEIECGECGRPYKQERIVELTYTTERMEMTE